MNTIALRGCVALIATTVTVAVATAQHDSARISSQSELVDSLDQANLQRAFRVLRQRFLRKDTLSYDELNRAALSGLLARLGNGADLVTQPFDRSESEKGPALRLVSEMLSSEIVYVRPASLSGSELKAFDSVLGGFQRSPANALVLDLRCPGGVDSFRNAADFASRFLPSGTPLFSTERPSDSGVPQAYSSRRGHIWKKQTVILVDQDTCPAGEVLAACLREHLGALIVGENTTGRTVEFEEIPLGASGVLRYAVAEVVLNDGTQLFDGGVAPDVVSKLDRNAKLSCLVAAQMDGVRTYVFESERARLNEAALVAGTNPELQDQLVQSERVTAQPASPPHRDTVLQTAVDILAAAHRLNR